MRRLLSRLEPLAPYRVQAAIGLLAVAIVAATGGVLLARDSDEQKGAALPEAGVETQGERDTSFLARIVPPPADRAGAADPRVPRTVGDLVRRLPVERKVAQLFLVGFEGKDLLSPVFRQLRRLDLGGIVIDRRNYAGPQTLGSLAGEARVIAADERHVPPWVMAPQEGGEFSVFRDLPPAGSPADIASPADAGRTAAVAGKTLRQLGRDRRAGPGDRRGPGDRPRPRRARVLRQPGAGGQLRGPERDRLRPPAHVLRRQALPRAWAPPASPPRRAPPRWA